ncbi:BatA domain-containing protein [Hymenobacter weizhouensis]|uniref:BatA domain-containing protein n=1 Tax=Hymenobacter sp. YIM 151500-1 TaxID=2987689 RepID=UPI002227CCB1|nr:BatA domain-containing protein [Hymenobacter sp. YIM 151500-1]UYZ63469.1 BatA domain-containing protein [Hymenobacter sp. YIM 151500-1]
MAFTYPWSLLGLIAVVIPIAIHLFELRRPQRVLFSNVEFIREVQLITARQRKLKQLLVLIARIGVIIFLVLLFAQPFIPAPQQTAGQQGAVSVVIDDSPSMQQQSNVGDLPLVEQAIQEAVDLPLAFPTTAQFMLWPGKRELLNPAAFRAAAEQVQVTGQSSDLGERLLQAQRDAQAAGPVFIFSDFQKSGFSANALQTIDTAQQVFLVPLASQSGPNVFVDSVWLDDALVRAGVDLTLQIRLRNGGEQPVQECQAKLFVGRQQAAVFRATVPAQKTLTTQVRVRLPAGKPQNCRIEVEDSPVDFDNAYYFTLQPAAPIPVVEVAADAQLNRLYGNEPLFLYQHMGAQAADYRKLATANLIIVREALGLGAGVREQLRQRVQQGATLVVVPPEVTGSQESYSRLFRELGVGPIQWQPRPQGEPVLQEVAMPSMQNPFFRDVFAGVNQRAGMPKAAPVLRWSRSGTDVLRMRDGEGYLAGFASGAGTVYVFAAPFSAPYSDFSQHPLFVPVLYRLALQSYQQEQRPAYRLTEQAISLRLPRAVSTQEGEQVYRLVQDSLVYIPTQQLQNGTLRLEVPPTLRRPGFYMLQRGNQAVATLAFNFDKRESDLRSYSAAELQQLVGTNRPNVQVYEVGQGQTVAARYKAARMGVPLWRYCLWVALACLLAESILLRWPRKVTSAPVEQAVAA